MATGVTTRRFRPSSERSISREVVPLPSDGAHVRLDYPGKLSEEEILAADPVHPAFVSSGQMLPSTAIEPNAVVFGDNIGSLRALLERYRRGISLIYLDPPYGTGLAFESRRQEHAYEDRMGQAQYLEFLRRRLVLMRELLDDRGSIYLHIGHQMLFHLKIVMDEVFGSRRFRNLIVRKKCSSKNYTRKQYANLNDYILFYTKGEDYRWSPPGEPATAEWIAKEYNYSDAKGRFKLVPVHAPGTRNGDTGKPWRGMLPPPGKHWQYQPATLDDLDSKGEIHWSKNGNPRRKVYLEENKAIPLTDYWPNFRDAHHQSIQITGYPTEKNLEMLRKIIGASSEPGDIVLDPFCGSGTTLHAANELGRRWLGIDQSFAAIAATVGRLKNGLAPMGDYVKRRASKPRNGNLFAKKQPSPNFRVFADRQLADDYSDQIDRLGI